MKEEDIKAAIFFYILVSINIAIVVLRICLPSRGLSFSEFLKSVKLFIGAFLLWPYYLVKFTLDKD